MVPLSLTPDELSEQHSGFWGYHMIARRKDGVTLAQAAQEADGVARQIMRDFPASMSAIHIQGDVRLLRETIVADVRPVLRTPFLAVAVVLLIGVRECLRLAARAGDPSATRICRSRRDWG